MRELTFFEIHHASSESTIGAVGARSAVPLPTPPLERALAL